MNYYMIQRLRGEKVGHPIFFAYNLDKASAGENTQESPYKDFYTNYSNSPLTFFCKHRKIDFDFYDISVGEYFVSSSFEKLAREVNTPDFKSISVQLLSSKREPLSKKDYFIIRLTKTLPAVDTKASLIEPAISNPDVINTKHLVIDKNIVGTYDLFRLEDRSLGNNLFCSEKFKTLAEKNGIVANFIPEELAAEEYAKTNPFRPK